MKGKRIVLKGIVLCMLILGVIGGHKDSVEAASAMKIAYEDYLVNMSVGDNSALYTLYIDLNDDDSSEMAILYQYQNHYRMRICTYLDDEVVVMTQSDLALQSWGTVKNSNQIFVKTTDGKYIIYKVGSKSITKASTYYTKKKNGKTVYYKNGTKISKKTYSNKKKTFKTRKAKQHDFTMALSKEETKIFEGKTKSLSVSGTIATVTWKSQDTSVATVDEDGTVTAVSEGTTNIVAAIGRYKLYCKVTVAFDVEGAKQNVTVRTWTNGVYVYAEMTNNNEFAVTVKGSANTWSSSGYQRNTISFAAYTLIPGCTMGMISSCYDYDFASYEFDFTLSRATDSEVSSNAGIQKVKIGAPEVSEKQVRATITNSYDEDLKITAYCIVCYEDGTFSDYDSDTETVSQGYSKDFDFFNASWAKNPLNTLIESGMTPKVVINSAVLDY
jgi:hypothetical protein